MKEREMLTTPSFIGIDVSKARLDVAARPLGLSLSTSSEPAGIAEVVTRIGALNPVLVVFDATGGADAARGSPRCRTHPLRRR